jgi:hypothetical protein
MSRYEDIEDQDWCVFDDIPCDHDCPGCEYNWKNLNRVPHKEVDDEQERQR